MSPRHKAVWRAAICAVIAATVAAIAPCSAFGQVSSAKTDRPAKWIGDLEHLVAEVRFRHVAPFRYGASEQEYLAAAAALKQRIPTLTDGRILLELFRLHALLKDTHSEALWNSIPSDVLSLDAVPVKFALLRDGVYIHATLASHEAFLGARLIGLGGTPIEDVVRTSASLISGDNEIHRQTVAVANTLVLPGVMHELGFSTDPEAMEVEVETAEGVTRSVTLDARPEEPDEEWTYLRDRAESPLPLWLTDNHRNYWFTHVPDSGLVYVQFNVIENDRKEPLEAFSKRLLAFVDAHDIDKLVIDLRHNSGGDNTVSWPLTHRIAVSDKINRRGHLFIIFGRGSKSAAPSFAIRMRHLTNVVFVGEPTGGRPNGYGNPSVITLPRSGVRFLCSQLFVQPTLEPDTRPWITPDITAEHSVEDLAENRDPALEAIVDYRPAQRFAEFVGAVTEAVTPADILEKHNIFRSDHRNKWLEIERDINRIGYALLGDGRIDDAIEIFEFNTRLYPTQPNTFDSLADAYLRKGLKSKAIALYKKSFLMGRNNRNALRQLEKLGWRATEEAIRTQRW